MGGGIFFAATFYVTAAIAVASALMVIIHRNPVISALFLVSCFFAVAVDYVLLQAHFLAVIQILLYAGAVLVLFLLIVMLLNLGEEEKAPGRPTLAKAIGVLAVMVIALTLSGSLYRYGRDSRTLSSQNPQKLAALLISLGAKTDEVPISIPEDVIKSSSAAENAGLARETLMYMATPNGLAALELPPKLAREITDEKLPDLFRDMARDISKKGDVKQIDVLPEYPNLNRTLLMQFLQAAVWARLNQYANLGTTESVGRALFKQWVLPFELSGLLLLSAILGVLLIARRSPKGDAS